jgi:glucokinase
VTAARGRALGIDIGGTKIAVAAVERKGVRIAGEATMATESERGFASGIRRILDTAAQVLAEAGWMAGDLDGVGIGCAGPVDPWRGTIHNPYTLPGWSDADIVTPLRDALGCPVFLENDADMALLGECEAGAGRGFDPVVMLTFGTGIGGAALVGGRLLRGAKGEHPELGHVLVDPEGPPCYCGTSGCFESMASGTALAAAARSVGIDDAPALLVRAARGDGDAQRLRARAQAATARATWTILHAILPQRLVLGGGMMDGHYELFAAAVTEAIGQATLIPKGLVTVARAELGARAGVVGAASAVWNPDRRE